MSPEETFKEFGNNFQEGLAQLLLTDRFFCDLMEEVLSLNFFEFRYLQIFAEKIFKYRREFKTQPTFDIINIVFNTELNENEEIRNQILKFANKIKENKFRVEGGEYIKTRALDFCKKQKLKEAMIKSIDLLKISSFDEIAKLINNAISLGTVADEGHSYVKDFEKRYEEKDLFRIPTGDLILDEIMNGGMPKGNEGVILGATGRGKSQFLCKLSGAAIQNNFKSLYITHELDASTIGLRHDSYISGIPINDLKQNKDSIYNTIKKYDGQLIIIYLPGKKTSINTLRSLCDRLKQKGWEPDIVLEDSLENIRPTTKKVERRHELQDVYEEYREFLVEIDAAGWTVSQVNRNGAKQDVLSGEDISEAYNKLFSVDFGMAFSRTNEEKISNSGHAMIFKNRLGIDGDIFPCYVDLSRVIINLLRKDKDEEAKVFDLKTEEEELKNVYRKFKNESRTKSDKLLNS